jgi:hypothetical protein
MQLQECSFLIRMRFLEPLTVLMALTSIIN